LFIAQQFTRAANLQIMRRQGEAGAEFLQRFQGLEALDRIRGHGFSRRRNQIGVGPVMRSAYAPSQLVNLRQSEAIRTVDDDGVRGGHVDAAFNDGGADQNIEPPVVEVEHQLFQIALAHLAVAHRDISLGHEFTNRLRRLFDGLDRVVDEIDLAAAANLAQGSFADHTPARMSSRPAVRPAES